MINAASDAATIYDAGADILDNN